MLCFFGSRKNTGKPQEICGLTDVFRDNEKPHDSENVGKMSSGWSLVSTHLKKYANVNLDHETPGFGVKIKNMNETTT